MYILNSIKDDAITMRKDNNYVLNGVLLMDIEAPRSLVSPSSLNVNSDFFMLIVYKTLVLNPSYRFLLNTFQPIYTHGTH